MKQCIVGFAALAVLALVHQRTIASVVIEFDTSLQSWQPTGGPFPVPLASDPGNDLGDSIGGYGFVDSFFTITLSSERSVNPGPDTTGKVYASPVNANGTFNGGSLPAIDPSEFDGQSFMVESFFDVFFDITITDVDSRPGRDFAGQPNGASISLLDNGPAFLGGIYEAVFDKDAPNFGLFPFAAADPYTGFFEIEIPLGADINGNGENDKIKIDIFSLSVVDENRTFSTLPDGTVINLFDSAAVLQGAVVDEIADPPFTIGQVLNGLPDPAVFGGPTTATSTLLNPVAVQPIPEPASVAVWSLLLMVGLAYTWRKRCKA